MLPLLTALIEYCGGGPPGKGKYQLTAGPVTCIPAYLFAYLALSLSFSLCWLLPLASVLSLSWSTLSLSPAPTPFISFLSSPASQSCVLLLSCSPPFGFQAYKLLLPLDKNSGGSGQAGSQVQPDQAEMTGLACWGQRPDGVRAEWS